MVMSKKFARMSRDKRAEMGVGTMIIFIAMVLVAAVAASVLISTSNTVREQATKTGNDAINNVASGFDIKYVKGTVAANKIISMDVYVQLSAGSPAIRMDTVTLSVTAGTVSGEEIYAKAGASQGTAPAPDKYAANLVPPAATNAPFDLYSTVQQGDLVKITINNVSNANMAVTPGTAVSIKIMPSSGATTTIMFTVPPVLSNGVVNLR